MGFISGYELRSRVGIQKSRYKASVLPKQQKHSTRCMQEALIRGEQKKMLVLFAPSQKNYALGVGDILCRASSCISKLGLVRASLNAWLECTSSDHI